MLYLKAENNLENIFKSANKIIVLTILFLDELFSAKYYIFRLDFTYSIHICMLFVLVEPEVRKFWLVEILTVITLKTYLRLRAALLYLKTKDVNFYPEILLPDLKYVCPAMLYSMPISTPISLAEKWLKYISKISKWLWV